MKYVYLYLLLSFFPALAAVAQNNGNTGTTTKTENQGVTDITAHRDFVVYTNSGSKKVTLTIEAKYESADKKFTLTDGSDTMFDIYLPLRHDFFTVKLNEHLKTKDSEITGDAAITNVYEIFYWVRSLVYDDDYCTVAGELYVNDRVLVFTNDDLNYEDRMLGKVKHDSMLQKLQSQLIDLNIQIKESLAAPLLLTQTTASTEQKDRLLGNKTDGIVDINLLQRLLNTSKINKAAATVMTTEDFGAAPTNLITLFTAKTTEIVQLEYTMRQTNHYCKIKEVEFQFERGYLEKVKARVEYNGVDQIFENIYAIGFSSPKDYKSLTRIMMYIRNSSNLGPNAAHIFLSDVIENYSNLLANYTRDYSPADTTLKYNPEGNKKVILCKERVLNLFEAKVFTDLWGVGKNEPNGLVQLELNRRFNLITSRLPARPRSDWGGFSYLNWFVNIAKIENKDRSLALRNDKRAENGSVVSPWYATTLDYRQYENFATGLELNAFLYDAPDAKLTTFIDLGFRYGLTPVTTKELTIDNAGVVTEGNAINFAAHTFTLYPKISTEIFSERRYGLIVSYQFNSTWLFSNNNFKQVYSYTKDPNIDNRILTPVSRNHHVIELFGRFEPNLRDPNSKIFARARFFMQQRDVNTFFPQIQIGYAYNLLFKTK